MNRMEPMSKDQQKAALDAARTAGLFELAVFTIGLCHTLRVSEFCDLRKSDVDLTAGTIKIRRLKKSLTTVEKLMPSEIEVIRELLGAAKGDRLFPVSRWTLYRRYRAVVETAGLPSSMRAPHCLKHSILQTLCDAGLSLPQLMKCGGHKQASSSMRYYEVKQDLADSLKAAALGAA